VNRASEDDELSLIIDSAITSHQCSNTPHSNEILHHELVHSFCRMRHVHFALSIPKVSLLYVNTNVIGDKT
jgi:hypothetical protein